MRLTKKDENRYRYLIVIQICQIQKEMTTCEFHYVFVDEHCNCWNDDAFQMSETNNNEYPQLLQFLCFLKMAYEELARSLLAN